MEQNQKKIISDVLSKFYSTNLSSETAREWIAQEIANSLNDENYNVNDRPASAESKQMDSEDKGIFEKHLRDMESQNKKINDNIKSQLEQKSQEPKSLESVDRKITKKTNENTHQKRFRLIKKTKE